MLWGGNVHLPHLGLALPVEIANLHAVTAVTATGPNAADPLRGSARRRPHRQ